MEILNLRSVGRDSDYGMASGYRRQIDQHYRIVGTANQILTFEKNDGFSTDGQGEP